MFHEWDKQLRSWLVGEIRHWHRGDKVESEIWKADFVKMADLLEGLGWKVRSTTFFQKLDACRLVVNVYKHGDGKSFDDLKACYPHYFHEPFGEVGGLLSGMDFIDHTNLVLKDEHSDEFSEAILDFWRSVPTKIHNSESLHWPDWFKNAILKDRAKSAG